MTEKINPDNDSLDPSEEYFRNKVYSNEQVAKNAGLPSRALHLYSFGNRVEHHHLIPKAS